MLRKRIISLLMVSLMMVGVITGCNKNKEVATSQSIETQESTKTETTQVDENKEEVKKENDVVNSNEVKEQPEVKVEQKTEVKAEPKVEPKKPTTEQKTNTQTNTQTNTTKVDNATTTKPNTQTQTQANTSTQTTVKTTPAFTVGFNRELQNQVWDKIRLKRQNLMSVTGKGSEYQQFADNYAKNNVLDLQKGYSISIDETKNKVIMNLQSLRFETTNSTADSIMKDITSRGMLNTHDDNEYAVVSIYSNGKKNFVSLLLIRTYISTKEIKYNEDNIFQK